jgi:hypothetical protein
MAPLAYEHPVRKGLLDLCYAKFMRLWFGLWGAYHRMSVLQVSRKVREVYDAASFAGRGIEDDLGTSELVMA